MNMINKLKNGIGSIKNYFRKVKNWWEEYEGTTFIEKLHNIFLSGVAYLIYDRNWVWLELFIDILCKLEMEIPLIRDTHLRHYIDSATTVFVSEGQKDCYAHEFIPKHTFYCEDCIYKNRSKIAEFFYGNQSNGYCYYLGKGDFSFTKPTEILWDGCKECGINEDLEEDNLLEEEYLNKAKEVWESISETKNN